MGRVPLCSPHPLCRDALQLSWRLQSNAANDNLGGSTATHAFTQRRLSTRAFVSPSPPSRLFPNPRFLPIASDASWRERATRLLAETERLVLSPIGAIKTAEEDKRRLWRLHEDLSDMVVKDLRLKAELQAGNFGKVGHCEATGTGLADRPRNSTHL